MVSEKLVSKFGLKEELLISGVMILRWKRFGICFVLNFKNYGNFVLKSCIVVCFRLYSAVLKR